MEKNYLNEFPRVDIQKSIFLGSCIYITLHNMRVKEKLYAVIVLIFQHRKTFKEAKIKVYKYNN